MRLNQYLAKHTLLSRRSADTAIQDGRITINNLPAKIGQTVAPADCVKLDNHNVLTKIAIVLMFHKPTGYICSRRQQGTSPTIYDLLDPQYHNLKPVGRLDKDSSGLLILTNDGHLAQRLTHPSFAKWKEYEVLTDRPLLPHDMATIQTGVTLEDGPSKLEISRHDGLYRIRMQEGRNRQIRRTFKAVGYTIKKLHRVKIGDLTLGNLKKGSYKEITGFKA